MASVNRAFSESRLPSLLGGMPGLLRGEVGRWAGLTLFFAAAAVVQTWPLTPHAADSVVTQAGWELDGWQFLWNLWWVKHALVDLHTNPFHTDFLYYPQGSDLYLHSLASTQGVLSIPLQLITNNLFLSWNLLSLLFFVLSGLGMYALSYRVTRNHAAALFSGYVFAFAPYIVMKFAASHWIISTAWPVPLFVLFLVRFQETGRLREAVAAAICWTLLTYNNLELGIDAGLFLGVFLVFWSILYLRRKERGNLWGLWLGCAVVVAVWLAVSGPMLIATLRSLYGSDIQMPQNDEFWSMDVTSFVTPSPLWGPGTAPAGVPPDVHHVPVGNSENTVYLGIIPLLLAGLAVSTVRRAPRRVLFWGAVFLFFAVLALGPYFYIGDTKEFSISGVSFSVPLPYQLYDQIPLFGSRRIPTRMIVFGLVGFAVLAAMGFDIFISWLREQYRILVLPAAVVLLALLAVEYWNPPLYLVHPPRPAVFEAIRDEPGDFSILHAPWGRVTGWTQTGNFWGGYMTNYYQTIHEKRSFGGWLSRASDSTLGWVGMEPGLRYLSCPDCADSPAQDDLNPELVRQVFRQYRIKYVVLHKLDILGRPFPISVDTLNAADQYLRGVAGLTPTYDDASFTIYRNQEMK